MHKIYDCGFELFQLSKHFILYGNEWKSLAVSRAGVIHFSQYSKMAETNVNDL